jgi:hypothetical protein
VPCFNDCCGDLHQSITPYDLLRIKSGLGISSSEVLARYASHHVGPQTGLPVVRLKPKKGATMRCPFVQEKGCLVYADRPSSCRSYPLARIMSRNRISGVFSEKFLLIQEPHCKGFDTTDSQNVDQWITAQGLSIYNEMNDHLLELISHKNQIMPGPLDDRSRRLFLMACYDLDRFRAEIFENGLLNPMDFGHNLMESARIDDTSLLKIGFRWVRLSLFPGLTHEGGHQ